MKRIETKDSSGKPNGYVLPIWSALESPELRPDQVYLTIVSPHSRKGPHLHMKRRGCFALLDGEVIIRMRFGDDYVDARLARDDEPLVVLPGTPCALYNLRAMSAMVLNMPSPAWSAEDPDEWPVENWQDPEGWK